MHHTLDRQQLLVPNVLPDVSKKKNAIDHQTLDVDQTSTGLNVITVLKKIANILWLALRRVQPNGQKVVWLKINVYAIMDMQDIQVLTRAQLKWAR